MSGKVATLRDLIARGEVQQIEFCNLIGDTELISGLARELSKRGIQCSIFSAIRHQTYLTLNALARFRMRALLYIAFPLRLLAHCLFSRPDLRVVSTNPFFAPWVCALTRSRRTRQVTWMFDLYPHALVATGRLVENSFVFNLIRRLMQSTVRHSDACVYLGSRLKNSGKAVFGGNENSHVIPIGSGLEELLSDQNPSDYLRLVYSGNLGLLHDTETLTKTIGLLSNQKLARPIEFVFAATGPGLRRFRAELQGVGSPTLRVRFVSDLDPGAWESLLQSSHIALVTMKPGAESVLFPSKAYSGLAAGQALLAVAPPESDLADLILDHDCGWIFEPGQASALASFLKNLACDLSQLELKQTNARHAAHLFTPDNLVEKWLDLPLSPN